MKQLKFLIIWLVLLLPAILLLNWLLANRDPLPASTTASMATPVPLSAALRSVTSTAVAPSPLETLTTPALESTSLASATLEEPPISSLAPLSTDTATPEAPATSMPVSTTIVMSLHARQIKTEYSPRREPFEPPASLDEIVEPAADSWQVIQPGQPIPFQTYDNVRITEQGEALLDLGNFIRLLLKRDTVAQFTSPELVVEKLDTIHIEPVDTPILQQLVLAIHLLRGGFYGELEPGGRPIALTTPNAVVIISGTTFFIVYDPANERTWVGNFAGTIDIGDIEARESDSLADRQLIAIPAIGEQNTWPIHEHMTVEEFDGLIDQLGSPIAAADLISGPYAVANFDPAVNIRNGPGPEYAVIGTLPHGSYAQVLAEETGPGGRWWQIACPTTIPASAIACWITANEALVGAYNIDPAASPTPSRTSSPTATNTPTVSPTPTASPTPSRTPTNTPTASPTPTSRPPATPTLSPTPTITVTPPQHIAFQSNRDGNWEIYVMNADGSDQTRLTNNAVSDINPAWSPDGTKIAFARIENDRYAIYVMNADGSNPINLTNDAGDDDDPAWSPDGKQIAFDSWVEESRDWEIFVMNADGGGRTRLTYSAEDDFLPAWSPDGRKIAFGSWRDGNIEVYMMDTNGSNQTNLTAHEAHDPGPTWSPDGTQIAFSSRRDGFASVYVMNADGSQPMRLTNDDPSYDYSPAWSPDGSRIAFQRYNYLDGDTEIYVMNADGSEQTNLTNNQAEEIAPDWQPRLADGG